MWFFFSYRKINFYSYYLIHGKRFSHLVCRYIDWLIGCLIDWLIGCLIDWYIDWFQAMVKKLKDWLRDIPLDLEKEEEEYSDQTIQV